MPDRPLMLSDVFDLPSKGDKSAAQKVAGQILAEKEQKLVESKLKTVPEITRDAAKAEVLRAVYGLLAIPIPQMLAQGWSTLGNLRDVGADSRKSPEKRFEVALGGHNVKSKHTPSLEILVNGQVVTRIQAEVSVSFKVGSAVLVIRNGAITGIEAAEFLVKGKLSFRGVEIASAHSSKLRLNRGVNLDPGAQIPT